MPIKIECIVFNLKCTRIKAPQATTTIENKFKTENLQFIDLVMVVAVAVVAVVTVLLLWFYVTFVICNLLN